MVVEAPHGHGLIPGAHYGDAQGLYDGVGYFVAPAALHCHLRMHPTLLSRVDLQMCLFFTH